MSYVRPLGQDGPITDPSQVDDTIVGEVGPTRVSCDALPADSPWRRPGQVCAPPGKSLWDVVKDWLAPNGAPAPTPAPTPDDAQTQTSQTAQSMGVSPLVILGGAAALYYLVRSRKRRA